MVLEGALYVSREVITDIIQLQTLCPIAVPERSTNAMGGDNQILIGYKVYSMR